MVKQIQDKLDSYGIQVYECYSVDDLQYFLAEDMMIVLDLKTNKLSVGFKAGCRPEYAATNILILEEINGIDQSKIEIVESFIYNKDKKLLYGDEAYDYINQNMAESVISQYFKTHSELSYLMDAKTEGTC